MHKILHSEEAKNKMRDAKLGKHHSIETKSKMRDAKLRKKYCEVTISFDNETITFNSIAAAARFYKTTVHKLTHDKKYCVQRG